MYTCSFCGDKFKEDDFYGHILSEHSWEIVEYLMENGTITISDYGEREENET